MLSDSQALDEISDLLTDWEDNTDLSGLVESIEDVLTNNGR